VENREIGDRSENRILNIFKRLGIDMAPTKGSGQVRGDGDFWRLRADDRYSDKDVEERLTIEAYIEAKHKDTSGHGVSKSQFDKAKQQAVSCSPPRKLLFLTENKDGEVVAHMPLEDLIVILRSMLI